MRFYMAEERKKEKRYVSASLLQAAVQFILYTNGKKSNRLTFHQKSMDQSIRVHIEMV